MTPPPDSNGIAGGVERKLTRPIIGIENRTAQEAFDIMADRIRSHLATTPDPTARMGAEAMREAAAKVADQEAIDSAILHDSAKSSATRACELNRVRGAERIAAAIRALPLPGEAS